MWNWRYLFADGIIGVHPTKTFFSKTKKEEDNCRQTFDLFIKHTYIQYAMEFNSSFLFLLFVSLKRIFSHSTFRIKCYSLCIAVIRKLFTFWLEDKQNNFVCFASIPLKALLRVYWLFKAVEYWQLKGCKSLEKNENWIKSKKIFSKYEKICFISINH